ncbi:MAG: hypothetical protein ACRCZF_06245, partial [Gemmataceae bacterium]
EFLSSLVELAAEGRTILISSHSISELERFISHVAFVKDGTVVLAQPLEEIRERFRRVEYRAVGMTSFENLGTVLQQSRLGKFTTLILQDADGDALEAFSLSESVDDFRETAMTLEDVYAAIMIQGRDRARAPVRERSAEQFEDELLDEGV